MKPRISIETKRAIYELKGTMIAKECAKMFNVSESTVSDVWGETFFRSDYYPSWPEPKRKVEKTAHGIFNVTLRENWLI